jgi:hypothetical protein
MNKLLSLGGIVVGVLCMCTPAGAQKEEGSAIKGATLFLKGLQAVPYNAQKEEGSTIKGAMPGPVHKEMAKRAGEYTTHSKFTAYPSGPAQESDGTAKLTLLLGGRFLQEENQGQLGGMPTTSHHLYGYNNSSKKYEAVWMYTQGTGMMTMTGTTLDEGKTVKYTAHFDDDNGRQQTLEVNTRSIDDDHFSVSLIGRSPEGRQGPTLETTYTRKK